MDAIVEKVLLMVLKQFLTPDVVKQFEKMAKDHAVVILKEMAASSENKIDDYIVQVVAEAFQS